MSANKPSQPTDRTSGQLKSSDDTLNAHLNNIPTSHKSNASIHGLGHLPARPGPQETTTASRQLLLVSVGLQRALDQIGDDLKELSPQEEGAGQ